MMTRAVVAACVLLFMCAGMVVLARRLRGVATSRILVSMLFPLSQILIIAFLSFYAIFFDLPTWLFVLSMVLGVACGPVDLALFKALREAEERDLAQERVRLLEEQLRAQEDYLRRLSEDIGEARRIREDIGAELRAVDDLLDHEEAERAAQGLRRVVDIMDSTRRSFCAHRVVDALLSMKATSCEEAGVHASFDVVLPQEASLSSVELCAVFSNLLDNAIHACKKVPDGERFIRLKAHMYAGYLAVRMENSALPGTEERARPVQRRDGALREHGWGMNILRTLADRHEGMFEAGQKGETFTTTVVLKTPSTQVDAEGFPCAS